MSDIQANTIVFNVIVPRDEPRMLEQLAAAWQSLRAHDAHCAVHLLHFGTPSPSMAGLAARHHVVVHELPPYIDMFGPSLADFPLMGKLSCIEYLPSDFAHAIYTDADVFWTDSPSRLVERYGEFDFVACPEVLTRGFVPYQYDAKWVDEDALAAMAHGEGLAFVAPFNTGCMMATRATCDQLTARRGLFIELVTRLRDGRLPLASVTPSGWLAEQVGQWLTIGAIPDVRVGYFPACDVPISNRWKFDPTETRVLSHYFSGGQAEFFAHHGLTP